MENNPPNEPEVEGKVGNIHMDPETWLQSLLEINANKNLRETIIQQISQKSGIAPEQVDEIQKALIKTLMEQTGRAN